MNLEFYSSHMATLKDLMEIAEKHNCIIKMEFNTNSYREIHADDLTDCGIKADLAEYIENNIEMKDPIFVDEKVRFILYEKDKDKYNTMIYSRYEFAFNYELDEDELESQTKKQQRLKKELISYLNNKSDAYGLEGFVSESDCPTIIYGFGNTKKITDYRVYREGMALKYFGDLVCDYLGEERINRVY